MRDLGEEEEFKWKSVSGGVIQVIQVSSAASASAGAVAAEKLCWICSWFFPLHSDLRVQTGSNYLHDQTQQKVFFLKRKKQLKDKILRENISDAGSQDVRSSGNLKRRRKLWASGLAGGFLPNWLC